MGLASPVLDRAAGDRRARPGPPRRQQLRPRGRRVDGPLRRLHPPFHPSDFSTRSVDGVGADWPIAYQELKPYYEQLEAELPVAGHAWPWGDPHRYPHSPHPTGGQGAIFLRGCQRLGIEARVGPVAIANGRFGNRAPCIYRGFCLQGCKVNAKGSPLITHVPDALAHGAEVRADAMYVCDGSVLPTQGSANPALTIMALAARCADHLAGRAG